MCDYPRIGSCINRKARKHHKCYECKRVIDIGQKYQYIKGNWDGKWLEFKTCLSCEELRDQLKYDGELAPFGELQEWASENGIEFTLEGWRKK